MATKTIDTQEYECGSKVWTARLVLHDSGAKAGRYEIDYFVPAAKGKKRVRAIVGASVTNPTGYFREWVRSLLPGKLTGEDVVLEAGATLRQVFAWYTDTVMIARGNESSTIEANKRIFNHALSFFDSQNVIYAQELIDHPGHFVSYNAHRLTECKGSTVNVEVSKIRAALRAAEQARIITGFATLGWEKCRVDEKEFDNLPSRQSIQILLDRMKARSSYYNATLFNALVGCRPVDVCRLRWSQVDLDRGIAHIRQTKTRRMLAIALSEPAKAVIRAEMARNIKSEYVFTTRDGNPMNPSTIYSTMKHFCDEASGPITPRNFREMVTTLLFDAGCDSETVKRMTGHRSNSVMTYRMNVRNAPQRAADLVGDFVTTENPIKCDT